ncbi:hypothetical protein SAMN05421749_10311 [Acinetobacter marinus]|uniref:Uncharacterized protein n=1 Tax=Acinetobacter marinus TaxID=281375 RepID=A0A1G6IFK3_9GAMM|nr:hypothetical protein [Acinetobacter marinus]SDC04795.1 hypothetical protein SAMN05421749_10311 [Acinetobacter marinus]
MKHITKLQAKLSKLSRAIDKSHPEYSPVHEDKLDQHLQGVIKQVDKLERKHDDLLTDICNINSMIIDLLGEMQDQTISQDKIKHRLIEVLDCSKDEVA